MRLVFLLLVPVASLAARADEPEVAVVVNPSFPAAALERGELETIFTSREHALDGVSLVVFNLAPDDPARVAFERVVLNMTPEQVSRFWVDQRIRGNSSSIRQVQDPELVLRLVAKLPGAISYVSAAAAKRFQGQVRIVGRIDNGKVLPP